jgi:hypothetical protein
MARDPGLARRILEQGIGQLLQDGPVKLALYSHDRIAGRVWLVTEPACDRSAPVYRDTRECRFGDMPGCVLKEARIYDEHGMCTAVIRGYQIIPAGAVVTVPLYVSVW